MTEIAFEIHGMSENFIKCVNIGLNMNLTLYPFDFSGNIHLVSHISRTR